MATSHPSLSDEDAHDLRLLIGLLEGNGDKTPADIVGALEKAWKKKTGSKKAPLANAASILNPAEVVAQLNERRGDPLAFEQTLNSLSTNKAVKPADAADIANAFRGTSAKFRSKAAAIDAIRHAWKEWQRDVSKSTLIREIF